MIAGLGTEKHALPSPPDLHLERGVGHGRVSLLRPTQAEVLFPKPVPLHLLVEAAGLHAGAFGGLADAPARLSEHRGKVGSLQVFHNGRADLRQRLIEPLGGDFVLASGEGRSGGGQHRRGDARWQVLRSTTLIRSRTFPGQAYERSASMADWLMA